MTDRYPLEKESNLMSNLSLIVLAAVALGAGFAGYNIIMHSQYEGIGPLVTGGYFLFVGGLAWLIFEIEASFRK